jgi:hypothetical protein
VELNQSRRGLVIERTVIAYWLIPSGPAHSFLQQVISDLATEYDAPIFEPHVTVYVGADDCEAAARALEAAERKCKVTALTPLEIDESDEFTKTLFVEFPMGEELRYIKGVIRQAANDPSEYELRPHLSLLYKNLAASTRVELAASIKVPFSEIFFDSVQAIRCISPTQTGADVKAWELIGSRTLR